MIERYLSILEVSQKQAYIFSDNKLSSNIRCSAEIAYITGAEFIEKCVADRELFSEDRNLVYAGGGHTILEFPTEENAKTVIGRLTLRVMKDFPDIELFAKITAYDSSRTPGENIKLLTAELEKKKALRKASFHQGSFGVERIITNTQKPELLGRTFVPVPESGEKAPAGFVYSSEFENLGGSMNEKNFIAVVHIDGNAMGKRIEALLAHPKMQTWQGYKNNMRAFSEAMAKQFRESYAAMEEQVAAAINTGACEKLDLTKDDGKICFPVRRVISEGDDICFVSEGRIGIECAVILLRELTKRNNPIDGEPYAACAGVALVHRKYPFYRAYELAEALCSNAKKLGPSLFEDGSGSALSCIDWHIEFGELQDSLSETRKQYLVSEKCSDEEETDDLKPVKITLEMRPYVAAVPPEKQGDGSLQLRSYDNFRKLMKKLSDAGDDDSSLYTRSLLKELRGVLKKGEKETSYYLRFHQMQEIGRDFYYEVYQKLDEADIRNGFGIGLDNKKIFIPVAESFETIECPKGGTDKKRKAVKRSILFDAIECMDTWVKVGE